MDDTQFALLMRRGLLGLAAVTSDENARRSIMQMVHAFEGRYDVGSSHHGERDEEAEAEGRYAYRREAVAV